VWGVSLHVRRPPCGVIRMWYCNTCQCEIYAGQEDEHKTHDLVYQSYTDLSVNERLR